MSCVVPFFAAVCSLGMECTGWAPLRGAIGSAREEINGHIDTANDHVTTAKDAHKVRPCATDHCAPLFLRLCDWRCSPLQAELDKINKQTDIVKEVVSEKVGFIKSGNHILFLVILVLGIDDMLFTGIADINDFRKR
jgi:hypothetical protein